MDCPYCNNIYTLGHDCAGLRRAKTRTDVDELFRLAEWARNNGFLIGDITIGSLSLKIRDLRIEDHEGLKPNKAQQSIWAEHGFDEPLPDGDGTVG
jgi:hypothetical protein